MKSDARDLYQQQLKFCRPQDEPTSNLLGTTYNINNVTPLYQNQHASTPIKSTPKSSNNLSSSNDYIHNSLLSPVKNISKDQSLSRKKNISALLNTATKSNSKKQNSYEQPINVSSESEFPKLNVIKSKCHKTGSANNCTSVISTMHLKQKKRVAPITLINSSGQNEFSSPVFRTENNLVGIDIDDHIVARDFLKTHKDSITKSFLEENQLNRDKRLNQYCLSANENNEIDLLNVSCINELNKMVNVYSAIIDLNLTTNVLSEISFLLNLLNTDFKKCTNSSTECELNEKKRNSVCYIFKNINNCIYFSIEVLVKQKHILCMLDTKTLKVLVENTRLLKFGRDLNVFLMQAYLNKRDIELSTSFEAVSFNMSGKLNVSYQQENDTKHNFPTIREFTAFNKQRDMFYNILR